MLPPNNLEHDESGVFVNETQYQGMIGSLMYLTTIMPDIKIFTCLCARYQANPKGSHLVAVKRIFKYRKGTPHLGCQILGGNLACWSAKKQNSVAMSSAKTEYVVVVVGCCAQVLWIKRQLADYDILYDKVGLATLGLVDEKNPQLTSSELINSSPLRIRYFSPIWRVLMLHIIKCVGVNTDSAVNKSLAWTDVQSATQSKAPTDKTSRKKKIPSSSEPKTSTYVKRPG
ncbi:hypothetical protein Tco_0383398 [Tanacetum coccineum]